MARSLPWVSIESTNDRGASRVVVLHPAYRNTLTGFIFTEIDTALKVRTSHIHVRSLVVIFYFFNDSFIIYMCKRLWVEQQKVVCSYHVWIAMGS